MSGENTEIAQTELLTETQKQERIKEAISLIKQGKPEEGQDIFYKLANNTRDNNVDTITMLGELAYSLGENVFAIHYFSKASEILPENAGIQLALARTYFRINNNKLAEIALKNSIAIDPNQYECFTLLGKYRYEQYDFKSAITLLEKALELNPEDTNALHAIIHAHRNMQHFEEALEYTKKLINIEPSARSYCTAGRFLIEENRFDEAIPYYNKAIDADKNYGCAYHELAGIKKFSEQDKPFIDEIEKTLNNDLSATDRMLIHSALGKIYDDIKEWDKAFAHFRHSNTIAKPGIEQRTSRDALTAAKHNFSKRLLNQSQQLGNPSDIPVFVVGMPRSGTTLIEQIIASHPDAAGAGELSTISTIHWQITENRKLSQPEIAERMNKSALLKHADEYLETLQKISGGGLRVVDKMPGNFAKLGLIHLLFPNAHIIHAVRNPLDTCLSCYKQTFAEMDFTCDLDWLAEYYRYYRDIMNYWKTVLPANKIIDVHYEQLTADPETQIRRLIHSCELPWNDNCLKFHNSSRKILTASLWQARQPIYTSSKKRWVNYAPHLAKLARNIYEYLDTEDIDEFKRQGIKIRKKFGIF